MVLIPSSSTTKKSEFINEHITSKEYFLSDIFNIVLPIESTNPILLSSKNPRRGILSIEDIEVKESYKLLSIKVLSIRSNFLSTLWYHRFKARPAYLLLE